MNLERKSFHFDFGRTQGSPYKNDVFRRGGACPLPCEIEFGDFRPRSNVFLKGRVLRKIDPCDPSLKVLL